VTGASKLAGDLYMTQDGVREMLAQCVAEADRQAA
jgi:hypothetical protein